MSEVEDKGTADINRKRRLLRFSCNFNPFPGDAESFPQRLHKEKVLLYKLNKSMDGLKVRFVVAVVTDEYSSVFVRYSRDNWSSETDIELTPAGSFAPSGSSDASTNGCFYSAVVPLSVLMPMENDSIQFRVGCSDGRLVKFDNNCGVMYEVQRLPSDPNHNTPINPGHPHNL